jgi:hypothetical protein
MNQRMLKLFPLIILTTATLYLLLRVFTTNVALDKFNTVAFVFLGIAIVTQIFNEKYGYWITGFLLILGMFSLAAFTPTIYYFKMGIIQLDLFSLPTLILFLVLHRKELPDWIHEILTSK